MRAKDIMTESIVCVNVKETVFDAAELLLGAGVSAAPVVNDQGNVLGIVSEADLIHRAELETAPRKSWLLRLLDSEATVARDYVTSHARNVADVMTREVVTASDEASLGELVELIEKHHVKRIPIVRDNKLVGIVSRANILGALLSREPDSVAGLPDDKRLRQAVAEAFDKQAWKSRWPVNVVVSDGVVHLWGFVGGEDVRKAYRVAAENVPGVKKVKSHLRSIPATVGMGV
jgi:CBS domain-containing protein